MNARQQEPPSSHLHGPVQKDRRAETAEETEAAAGGTRGRQGHTGGAEWADTTGSRQGREKHETQ